MAPCPNCGKEIQEDFTFCPYCEYPLKPFCPSCKREVAPEYVKCPYCGFMLKGGVPAQQLYLKHSGFPASYLAFALLYLLTGALNIGQGITSANSNLSSYDAPTIFPSGTQSELVILVIMGSLIVILGVAQLVASYGLLTKKQWSKSLATTSAFFAVLLYLVTMIFDMLVVGSYYTSPPWLQLISTTDIVLVAWSVILLAMALLCLRGERVWELLNPVEASDASKGQVP